MADEVNLHAALRQLVADHSLRTGVRVTDVRVEWDVARTVGGNVIAIVKGVQVISESL